MTPRRQRAAAIAEAAGANALVVAHPSAVTWLTGYAPEIETGPSPFALSAIAVLAPGCNPVLVVSEHAAAGISELELWAAIRGSMESAAQARLPVLADLVSGPRTAEVGGPPSTRVLAKGDLVLCDLVPRVGGYWGDSCATFAIGGPSAAAQAAHAQGRSTLTDVVAAIRPGAVAGELDALARAQLEFPHHTGHGLGTSWHEEPRLIPGSTTVLEEGMVVAVEPGAYDGVGVRLEQVVLVTAEGCDVLSGHDLSL